MPDRKRPMFTMTECEARALAAAVSALAAQASAPDSARDHTGKATPGGGRA